MSCICQNCQKLYKVDVNIPDELWEKIRNDKNLLCGKCIMKKIEALDYYDAYELERIDNGRPKKTHKN